MNLFLDLLDHRATGVCGERKESQRTTATTIMRTTPGLETHPICEGKLRPRVVGFCLGPQVGGRGHRASMCWVHPLLPISPSRKPSRLGCDLPVLSPSLLPTLPLVTCGSLGLGGYRQCCWFQRGGRSMSGGGSGAVGVPQGARLLATWSGEAWDPRTLPAAGCPLSPGLCIWWRQPWPG